MLRKTLFGCLLALTAATTLGDTLLIDGIAVDQQSASSRPRRGITMANVEAQFGAPTERVPAVGEPPITRWEYPGFTVVFEHDKVLHSVVRH
jgi:hypothetical protein